MHAYKREENVEILVCLPTIELDDVASRRRMRKNYSAMAYVMTTCSQRLEILDIRNAVNAMFLLVNSHFSPPMVILNETEPI